MLILAAGGAGQARTQEPITYRVVTTDGTRPLAVHASTGSTDIVTLDAAARLFGLTVRDDPRAGGAVVLAGATRIVLTAGQNTVSAGGRLVSLSAPITRAGTTWLVPVDFFRTLGLGIDVRRPARLIVVPPAVVPHVTPRFERTATGGRLLLAVEPATPARVSRDGAQVTIRFQANALDLDALAGAPADLVAALRISDASLLIDLGAGVTNVRADDARDPGRVTIDLVSAAAAAPATPSAVSPVPLDRTPGIRTVLLDPGHGGDDAGARSASGLLEKDVTLLVAMRVKALLEARLGVRVVLTRESDTAVPLDRRAAIANNNKADVFVSLHANGSPRPEVRGVQVLSLDVADYAALEGAAPRTDAPALPVPVAGGGTRVIDAVPWQLAQLPHARLSAALAAIAGQRLAATGVPMHPRAVDTAPLRVLVGANMPAILIELGVLTNEHDARVLGEPAHLGALADAIATAIADVRTGVPLPGDGGGQR